ncbi:hypothetical protein T10_7599 [Trichinella papuae]|uniref:Uncharacterized protein n=1 Tax=Trichinella papuae TaxID=268474 RepID=A0A0V1MK50_9BILA|nr:hypothetical protein T10_7599 [Trichinella papuae]
MYEICTVDNSRKASLLETVHTLCTALYKLYPRLTENIAIGGQSGFWSRITMLITHEMAIINVKIFSRSKLTLKKVQGVVRKG